MTQDGDTRTSFSDDGLAVENSVEGEAIFILITSALKKGTEPGLALEPGCEHSWVSDSVVRRQCSAVWVRVLSRKLPSRCSCGSARDIVQTITPLHDI
jgi:hypothetical protein